MFKQGVSIKTNGAGLEENINERDDLKMEYKLSVSVEKVVDITVNARSEDEAIEIAKQKMMNGREDFAQILDVCIVED